jgi:20S proteasome alpha/beta subunit
MFTDADLSPELLDGWRTYDFGCQMLVGAFNLKGQAYLLRVDGNGKVMNVTYPGFGAIGSGSSNAVFWLSYRNHNLSFSVRRSAYHAFEAKIMAESSAFVNEKLDMVMANRDQSFIVTDTEPAPPGAPVSLIELREMFSVYGPKTTDDLK